MKYHDIGNRILSNSIIDENGCWNWTKTLNKWGYAKFVVGSRTDGSRRCVFVHRASYEYFIGKIPDGLVIDHLCRNNKCQNPEHLEPVTTAVNNARNDKLPPTINASKKVCPKCGGEWTQLANRRQCEPCMKAYYKAYNANRRGKVACV